VPNVWVQKRSLICATIRAGSSTNSSVYAAARLGNRQLGPCDVLLGRSGVLEYLLRPATAEAAASLPPPPVTAALAAAAAADPGPSDESEADEAKNGEEAATHRPVPPAAAAATASAAIRPASSPAGSPSQSLQPSPPPARRMAAPRRAARDTPPLAGPARKKRRTALPAQLAEAAPAAYVPGLPPEITAMLAALPLPGSGDATPKERRALLATALMAGTLPVATQLPESSAWVLGAYAFSEVKTARHAVLLLRVRRMPQLGAPTVAPAAQTSALDRYTR